MRVLGSLVSFVGSLPTKACDVVQLPDPKINLPLLRGQGSSLIQWLYLDDPLAQAASKERAPFRARLMEYQKIVCTSQSPGLILPLGMCADLSVRVHRLSMACLNLEGAFRGGSKVVLVAVDGSDRGGSLKDIQTILGRVKDPRLGACFVGHDPDTYEEMRKVLGSSLQAVIADCLLSHSLVKWLADHPPLPV